MSRTLRMSKSNRQDIEDIEDINQILEEANENQDEFDEDEFEEPEEFEEEVVRKPSRTIPAKVKTQYKGTRTIEIQELDPDIIPPSSSEFMDPEHTGTKLAVIGKPGTGKSSLIRSLLYEKSEIFPCAQVYSGTEDSNHSYSKFIPSIFIHNKFDQVAYENFIRRQKISKKFLTNPWAVCVWDDITENEAIFRMPLIKGTYKNGRHWKMLHILSLQYALDIKPVIRTNIDGAFLLRESNNKNRVKLYENYASAVDNQQDFIDIFNQVTNNYTSLYIHNRVQSNKFEDCVFWYKARQDIPSDFKFGCKEFWMFHEERYNLNYVDPITV